MSNAVERLVSHRQCSDVPHYSHIRQICQTKFITLKRCDRQGHKYSECELSATNGFGVNVIGSYYMLSRPICQDKQFFIKTRLFRQWSLKSGMSRLYSSQLKYPIKYTPWPFQCVTCEHASSLRQSLHTFYSN